MSRTCGHFTENTFQTMTRSSLCGAKATNTWHWPSEGTVSIIFLPLLLVAGIQCLCVWFTGRCMSVNVDSDDFLWKNGGTLPQYYWLMHDSLWLILTHGSPPLFVFHQVWIQGLWQVVDLVYNMALTLKTEKIHFQIQTWHKTDAALMTTQTCRSDNANPLFSMYHAVWKNFRNLACSEHLFWSILFWHNKKLNSACLWLPSYHDRECSYGLIAFDCVEPSLQMLTIYVSIHLFLSVFHSPCQQNFRIALN